MPMDSPQQPQQDPQQPGESFDSDAAIRVTVDVGIGRELRDKSPEAIAFAKKIKPQIEDLYAKGGMIQIPNE